MAKGKVITDLMSDGYHVNTSCIEQHTCWIDIYSHFPKTISHTRIWNVSHVWNLRCWMSMVDALADTHFQKQQSSLQKASSENPWKTAHIWYFFNISLWFFSNKNPINYGFSTGTVFSIYPNTGVYAHIWPYMIVFFDQIDIVQKCSKCIWLFDSVRRGSHKMLLKCVLARVFANLLEFGCYTILLCTKYSS